MARYQGRFKKTDSRSGWKGVEGGPAIPWRVVNGRAASACVTIGN